MPVEFALRPRIRLRELPAPARRARARLPKFALPALAYWLVIGGLVYEFVRHHEPSAPLAEAEAALAPLTPSPPAVVREWWRPLPTPAASPPPARPSSEPPAPEVGAVEAPIADAPPLHPAPEAPGPSEARLTAPALRRAPKPALGSAAVLESDPVNVPSGDAPAPVPRLDPLFALAPTLDPLPAPTGASALAPVSPTTPGVSAGLPSCEAARAAASQDIDFSGGNRTADLPTQAIAAVLENGAWLSSCALPAHTALDVCVAMKGGRVVGASVISRPADAALSACVKRRASSLQFPYSPHLDLARTRF